MSHLRLAAVVGCIVGFAFSSIGLAAQPDFASLRKVLLQADSGDRYGLSVPKNDPRLRAIKRLEDTGSSEAAAILQEFLTAHGLNQKLKQHALTTLGRLGTQPAVNAIRAFEAWSRKRLRKPAPFRFGAKDYGIYTFTPHELHPLAKATDETNKRWALFAWERFGRQDLWLSSSLANGSWSQPILLSFPDIPEVSKDTKCELQIKGDSITVILDGRTIASQISKYVLDSDKDGLADLVEARILTDVNDRDTDKDSIPDGEDSNPLTQRQKNLRLEVST